MKLNHLINKVIRCDSRDSTKNLGSFITIVVPSKKYTWGFFSFSANVTALMLIGTKIALPFI